MNRALALVALLALALAAPGCTDGEADSPASADTAGRERERAGGARAERPPAPPPYRPSAAEGYPNGKRLAARVAQAATTYEPGASPSDVADAIGPSTVGRQALSRVVAPIVDPDVRSTSEVVYPQLSGVTPTSLGAMVLVRQTLEDDEGSPRSVTRVLDVRLVRGNGPWQLEQIGSVGGMPPVRSGPPSEAAAQVLENPRIELSDSARWDIERGEVDETLLQTLAASAARRRIYVGVLRSGHPPNVWATTTPSAHTAGYAADIWAVDGRPVVDQPDEGSPAFELAGALVAGGAAQVGSPWTFGAGGSQSFSDDVHQDHIHLQQTPVG